MKWLFPHSLVLAVVLASALTACTPKAASPPTPPPAASSATPTATMPTTPQSRPEDAAWAKVVEAARKEGTLTVYSANIVGQTALNVSQAFTKRTGLRLEAIGGPAASNIERIKTERRLGQQIASVIVGNTAMQVVAKQQDGLTQSVGDLPELKTMDMRFDPRMDKEGHVLALTVNPITTWVNTKLVPPGTEPKSYKDLLKSEWKGKMAIADPVSQPQASMVYWPLTNRGRLDDNYFRALSKQALQFRVGSRADIGAVARGEAHLVIGGATPGAAPLLAEGAPLKAIDMVEGVPLSRSTAATLVQGAPSPNGGRVFINWLFSQEGQTVFLQAAGLSGPRKDVPSFEPPEARFVPAYPINLSAEDELQIGTIQRELVVEKLLREGGK